MKYNEVILKQLPISLIVANHENQIRMINESARELFEIRNESEDLEQCRACFASHLDKIQKVNPENWTRNNLSEKLERATTNIDLAADEYDQAAAHFEGTRSGGIFGRPSKRGRANTRANSSSEFKVNLRKYSRKT